MATKKGPSTTRASYRRDEPQSLESGLLFAKHMLTPEAVNRGVRVVRASGLPPRNKNARSRDDERRRYVLRILPALDESNAEKILPTFVESEDGVQTWGPWFENVQIGTYGADTSRVQSILYDPASPAYSEGRRPEAINPYSLLFRTCNTNQSMFGDLIVRENDEVSSVVGKPSASVMVQAYVCQEKEPGLVDVEKTLKTPPTLVEIPFMAATRLLKELKKCLTRKVLKDNGEEYPETLEKGVVDADPLSLDRGVFVIIEAERGEVWSEFTVTVVRALADLNGQKLTASFNQKLTAEVAIDRWQWWADTLHWMTHKELVESMVHSLRHSPKALAAIQLAWEGSDEDLFSLLSPPLAEELQKGAKAYHEERLSDASSGRSRSAAGGSNSAVADDLPDEHDVFGSPEPAKAKAASPPAKAEKTKGKTSSSTKSRKSDSASTETPDSEGDDISSTGEKDHGQLQDVDDDLDDLTEEDREALRSLQEDDSEEGGVDEDLDESEDESEDDSESLGDDLDDDLPEEALDLSHADDDEDEPVAAAPKQEANGSVAKKATRSAKGKSAKSK